MKFPLFLLSFAAVAGVPAARAVAVGPDYVRPETAAPADWREAGAWQAATPATLLPHHDWWRLYQDPALDQLETSALAANQTLRAAAARGEQARAAAGLARSAFWPAVGLNAGVARARTSETTDNLYPVAETTTHQVSLDAGWELDLFGRVRRLNEAARAEAEAGAADFAGVRLALTAEVAADYFTLRALDREASLVGAGVELRRRALELVSVRRAHGADTDFDVARAEAELAATQAEAAVVANRRAALQGVLAVLLGQPAPDFALPVRTGAPGAPPVIPAGLPSRLLERRPDVAAAEAGLIAANARIGVARAAFFPALSLTGSAGYASGDIDRLLHADSRVWSIGPSLYLPIFQGGRNRANLARSRAAYDESVAAYRQRVLVAFREVQDALTATQLLAMQAEAQERAVTAARRAGSLAQARFDAGYVNYFEVLDTQRTVLADERAAAQLDGQRLVNSVALIKALGGGWDQPHSLAAAR